MCSDAAGGAAPGSAEEAASKEEWAEERGALEAIYAGEVAFPSECRTTLALEGGLTLDVRLAPGSAYPLQPPVLAIR